ncbi:hypothetical protein TSMEX_008641 [Taenia solium]|eukprot:TsM_000267300 transcript=TsM_000267300 gene=TsM_000267300
MNKEKTQPKEQGKKIPLGNEEMHELSDHEYCNRSAFPESGFKGVSGAVLLPNSQPERQTPEESKQGSITSNLKAESAGDENENHTSSSPTPLEAPTSKRASSKFARLFQRFKRKRTLHKNRKSSPRLNSNDRTQGLKSETTPADKAPSEYLVPLEKRKSEPHTYENQGSPTLLSIAQSKAPASATSVAEAKDWDKNAYQNARNSEKNPTEPMGGERDLHKEQGKGTLLRDKEMLELSGQEYCNRLDALERGFKGVNGAVLASVSQPEKQTPDKSEKETPNSKSEAKSTGDENKTNVSVSPSPSPKPIETHSKADRSEHHSTKRHTLPHDGENSPRLDSGVVFVGKDNSDTSVEGKSSPKSEIVSSIKASHECSVPLEENKNNEQPDMYESRNLSTPVSVVHSEVMASCVPLDEREHEEEEGEHSTRDNCRPSPAHYNKVQSLGRHEDHMGRKFRRNPMERLRRHRKSNLRTSRSEETLLQPLDLDIDPKFASQYKLLDISSSRSRYRKSPWRKFSGLFKKEPMPTFDVVDPAEEQQQQENCLLNDPMDVKGEGEVRIRCLPQLKKRWERLNHKTIALESRFLLMIL